MSSTPYEWLLPDRDPLNPEQKAQTPVPFKQKWGTVRPNGLVRLDADTVDLPADVDSLYGYSPGDRVYCLLYGKRVTVIGRKGGDLSIDDVDGLAAALDGKANARAGMLGTGVDLNTYKTPGAWIQHSDAGAESGANYPNTGPYSAGLLEVNVEGGGFVFQRYTQWQLGLVWARTFYNYASEWKEWELVSSPTGAVSLTIPAWAQNQPPVFATSASFPRPFTPPDGYGFEAYLLQSSGFTFISTSHSGYGSATNVSVRILQIASAAQLTIRVGWRLVKI